MTNYKDTLNLLKTNFPMKANLPLKEPEILAFWQEIDLYQQLRATGETRPKFILHDGPPYANGQIHIGHAINKTLKDIIVKAKTLSNYDAPYVPGWDCHGLPIELNVEKKIHRSTAVSPREFIKACRDYAATQVEIQKEAFVRLGILGDWSNPYLTMSPTYESNIIRALAKIIKNGHLQQGHKPVQWCTECGSALAEAEVEYKDKTSSAIDVLFRVVNNQEFATRLNLPGVGKQYAVPIWTTTPWTLPANEAVALNPDHEYCLIESLGRPLPMLVVAQALLENFLTRCEIKEYRVVKLFMGQALNGLRLHHPFLSREIPVVLGGHVTLDAGTGAVHTAPAHGQDDYIIGQQYKLPIDNPVDGKGVFLPGTPFFAGKHVFKVNPDVIAVLEDHQNLLHQETITHSYAHCWRHKTPLIYRATPQWFISMEKNGLREEAIAAIDQTQWIPEWGQMRIKDMVQKRPDWCISRQRIWNTPIPLFVHQQTRELHPRTMELLEEVANRVEQGGIEIWQDIDMSELLGADAADYEKVTDTLDVWFDAGVSHECVLRLRPDLVWPADLYLEGSDQHRGWFQTSLLSSVAMYEQPPFKAVLTHGFTVDANGRKMSKSLGNTIAPDAVINKRGADVLRFWVATTDYRGEMTVSEEIFERASEAYRRIRNTIRFFLTNLEDFADEYKVSFNQLLPLDQWAVDSAKQLQHEIISAYDNYQFHQVAQKIHNFCSLEMGGFYLDVIKDRLYTAKTDGIARRSAQTALYHLLQAMVRWIAPILSFTAEEVWQQLPNVATPSVFLTTWYQDLDSISSQERENWREIMMIREKVNQELERSRNAGEIGSGLAAEVALYCDTRLLQILQPVASELRFILITSEARLFSLDDYKAQDKSEMASAPEKLELKVMVKPSTFEKCQRCWHRRRDVGMSSDYPEICERCIENIAGEGEDRHFA